MGSFDYAPAMIAWCFCCSSTMGGRANSPSPTNDAELTDGSEEDVFVESVTGPVEQCMSFTIH